MTKDEVRAAAERLVEFHERFAPLFGKEQAQDNAYNYVKGLMELAPWGLAMTKEMLNRAASTDYSSAIDMEAFTQTLLMTADDFREFHAGFTGKRKPQYRGR